MEQNKQTQFNKLLEKMLENYEVRENKTAEEVVCESLKELGVSENAQLQAANAGKIIDCIQEKAKDLEETLENPFESRERWVSQQLTRMTEKLDAEEDKKALIEAFNTVPETLFVESLK